jgi:hypothetical protein
MSYGAYFATEPSTRTYVDTSQGLMGDDLLAIYDGVAGVSGLGASPGCGCSGKRGSLRGFGNEVLPDGGSTEALPGVTQGTNLQTALVALLAVASVVAIGVAIFGSKPMRANGRRRRAKRTMRRNGRAKPVRKATLVRKKRLPSAGLSRLTWKDHSTGSDLFMGLLSRGRAQVVGDVRRVGRTYMGRTLVGRQGSAYPRASLSAAKAAVTEHIRAMLRHERTGVPIVGLRRNGAEVPAYLLKKKGRTTKRQSHAAAHYLAETRWGGNRKKKVAKWSGKHLAHYRFHTNASR